MLIVAEALAGGLPSTVVAVKVIAAAGILGGGVYVVGEPLAVVMGETDPHSAIVQATSLSVSVQSMLPDCRSFAAVATNCVDPFNATLADVGNRPMEIAGGPTAILSWTSGEVIGGLAESVTWTLKLKLLLAPLGVPVIIPVWLRASVSGNEVPPAEAHVRVPAPPFAASWKLYGLPRVAAVIVPVVATVGGGETVTGIMLGFARPVTVAVTVTEFDGTAPGAVYVAGAPLAVCLVIAPQLPPPHASVQSKP
jgi:hypothetical protein